MTLNKGDCRDAEPKDKAYKLSDGGGLYLEVVPNGGKYWRMKYRFNRKEKRLSFGVYPIVELEDARDMRHQAKKLLSQGIDPSKVKQENETKRMREAQNTFKAVALEWHENRKDTWSEDYASNTLRRMEADVFPYIGTMPIATITAPDVLDALRKIEKRGSFDIAGRTRQICGQVFRYGIQTGRCDRDIAVDLRGALKTRKTKHFAAIDVKEIPELLEALERNDARLYARTRRAIKLSMLVFTRPGEIRQAEWKEINFEEKQWIIPAERMKMRRPLIVPLSSQAIQILREQQEETGHINTPFVFPGQHSPRKPMCDAAVRVALHKLGFKGRMTAHGFRALARTGIREKLNYDPDVIECQLAHKAAGPLGEAYNRAQFVEKRRVMMQEWADYIDSVMEARKQHPQRSVSEVKNAA